MATIDFLIIFFPAMAANAFPVILGKLPYLTKPINKKLFGENKTWKGLILGILMGGFSGYCIEILSEVLNYPIKMNLYLGLLLGSGALVGDLTKSYLKRRVGIKPGHDWFPFDQVDWIIGACIFSYPLFSFNDFIILLFLASVLHVITNRVAIILKLKKSVN